MATYHAAWTPSHWWQGSRPTSSTSLWNSLGDQLSIWGSPFQDKVATVQGKGETNKEVCMAAFWRRWHREAKNNPEICQGIAGRALEDTTTVKSGSSCFYIVPLMTPWEWPRTSEAPSWGRGAIVRREADQIIVTLDSQGSHVFTGCLPGETKGGPPAVQGSRLRHAPVGPSNDTEPTRGQNTNLLSISFTAWEGREKWREKKPL